MTRKTIDMIRTELKNSLPDLDQKILVQEIEKLADSLSVYADNILEGILNLLDEANDFRFSIYSDFQSLNLDLPKQRTREEKIQKCIEFLATFTSSSQLKEDRKAFGRWMDITAVRERARIAMHESDRRSEMILHYLLSTLITQFEGKTTREIMAEKRQIKLSQRLEKEFNDSPRWQNRVTVFKVWEGLFRLIPPDERIAALPEFWSRIMTDIMSSPEENPWVQIQAFKTMAVCDPDQCLAIVHHRFSSPSSHPDDVFLRTDLLELLNEHFSLESKTHIFKEIINRPDPSEHVRIKTALNLSQLSLNQAVTIISQILLSDSEYQDTEKVRAAATISLGKIIIENLTVNPEDDTVHKLLNIIENSLRNDQPLRVQLALIEALLNISKAYLKTNLHDCIDALDFKILRILDHVVGSTGFFSRTKRVAMEYRETIILERDPDARELMELITRNKSKIRPGEYFSVPNTSIPGEILLGRILAWASQSDYGYYAMPGESQCKIYRGEHFKRRAWRILHELTNPDPAKRQGFRHTTARWYPGTIRSHARYLCETTETKVPGERLFHSKEYSWRPYLPTVDDLLSLYHPRFSGKEIKIFSAEGVFTLSAGSSLQDMLMGWWEISINYRNIVGHRNGDPEEINAGNARSFTQYITEDLHIEVAFEPHRYEYDGKIYQVIDSEIATHLYPAIRNPMEWSVL